LHSGAADKTADNMPKATVATQQTYGRLLTKLLTKMIQTTLSELLNSLFCVVSAEGIEPSTYD